MRLIHGECLEEMQKLIDEGVKVDAVICDPPYGTTKLKWDKVIQFDKVWDLLDQVSTKGCPYIFTAIQPYTTLLNASNIKNYKYNLIWEKTKPTGYQIAKIKPLSIFEDICIFSNGGGKITYNPQMVERDKPRSGRVHSTNNQMKISDGGVYAEEKTYTHRYPNTIVKIPNGSQKNKVHPTQKPVELIEYLIKTYTDEGDTVLDFTMGSGTTGVACKNLNRDFIGIELDDEYFDIAKQRIEEKED